MRSLDTFAGGLMVKFQSLKRQQKKRKTVVQIKTGSRIAQIIPKNNLIFDRV
jgi:hypothetical protein